MKSFITGKKYLQQYLIAFAVLTFIVLIISVYYLKNSHEKIREKAYKDLEIISTIKTESILNFINEEKFKLQTLINSDFFKSNFWNLLNGRTNYLRVYNFLVDVKSIKHLEDIIFIDPEGKILFSFTLPENIIDSMTLSSFHEKNSKKILIDIYKGNKSNIIYAFQFPLIDSSDSIIKLYGYIRFQFDALNTLIPQIEYIEPYSSKEILLLKKDKNEIIYLSYLRNIPVKPLNLKEVIYDHKFLEKLSNITTISHYEGMDYSGESIIAVLQKIPGTDWILMSKQNQTEVYKDFKNQILLANIIILLSLSSIGFLLLFFTNQLRLKQEIRELELKASKDSLEQELELISNQISDAVFILNENGEIIKGSKSVGKIYGYKPEELVGKKIDIICQVNLISELNERFKKIEESGNYIYESIHKRKDGTLIDVEINARYFKINNEKFLIGSVRDITLRKEALKQLQEKLEIEKFLIEIASEMINIHAENFEPKLNRIFNRIADFIKVDRIRLFCLDKRTDKYNCKLEWHRYGLESFKEQLQFLDLKSEYPFLHNLLTKGITYFCSDVELLQDEAEAEKIEFLRQGVKSFFWIPLKFKEDLKGFISFITNSNKKSWNQNDELLAKIFGDLLLNTILRIESEKIISENEKKFRKLVENSSDVILIVSKDFKNKYVSPTLTKVIGYTYEERFNQNPLDLIHPEDLEIVLNALDIIPNSGDKITIQFRVLHKLGHYLWVEATITNLIDDSLINGWVVNYHDITELKETFTKLQESEEKYRILTEESGDVLYKLNYSTMKYEYMSPVIQKLTGYEPEEINEIGFNQIIESISMILNPVKTIKEIREDRIQGKTGEYLADYKIRTKTGEFKWVRDHSFPVLNEDGKIIGSIGILSDISELKSKEEEIKKREKLLEVLVDLQKTLIYIEDLRKFYNYMLPKLGKLCNVSRCYVFENSKDENGRLLMNQIDEWCEEGITPQINNPNLQNLPYDELGIDLVEEFIETGYWAKIVKYLPEPIKTILEDQDIISILLIPIFVKDEFYGFIGFDECRSERIWTEMEIEILQSVATSIALAIETRRHQHEIIRAKDEIIEANRLRSGFLSLLSHEIRTPLNVIIGYNELLEERFNKPGDEELSKYFKAIRNNGMRLLNTINQLIEISKLNAGAVKVNIQNLDLKKYIKDVCNNLKVKADEKNLILKSKLSDEELKIVADDFCLHGILENLVMNAIKYSQNGMIEIMAKPDDEIIEVIVKDQGIGIDEKYLPHLFEPFSQEDVSYKRSYEGTGLGLAITKRYLDLIGGEIHVESKKGVGTTVHVRFRRAC